MIHAITDTPDRIVRAHEDQAVPDRRCVEIQVVAFQSEHISKTVLHVREVHRLATVLGLQPLPWPGTTSENPAQALVDAVREVGRIRREVRRWMDDEATHGNLRLNHDAPAWSDYEAAENALRLAMARLDPDCSPWPIGASETDSVPAATGEGIPL